MNKISPQMRLETRNPNQGPKYTKHKFKKNYTHAHPHTPLYKPIHIITFGHIYTHLGMHIGGHTHTPSRIIRRTHRNLPNLKNAQYCWFSQKVLWKQQEGIRKKNKVEFIFASNVRGKFLKNHNYLDPLHKMSFDNITISWDFLRLTAPAAVRVHLGANSLKISHDKCNIIIL